MLLVNLDRLQFRRWKAHAGVRPETHRIVRRTRAAAQSETPRQCLLQELAETVQVGLGHTALQRLQQAAGLQPGIR
ncbi:hypothetical protein D3C80_2003490 [compost metagenome]